jgi:TolB-like protein/DNA-binding SARP family transcriptional activator/Tfp pilus assembly protein PilF
MAYLRVLGGLSIEADADTALTGRAAQRRRLAILALLASAPSRCLSRDKLIGYLWPEQDEEQARHRLSVAVYDLRKALGEKALLTHGEDLCLDSGIVRSDLAAFEEALERQSYDRATELYAGPFLDGVYLSDAPEFERWVEEVRDFCARKYRQALEDLAQQRGDLGDLAGAIEAWRRVSAADAYNSRIALRLMQVLHAAGNRAAALQHAQDHTELLQREFGAEPDPEIAAFAERLRAEPAAVAGQGDRAPAAGEIGTTQPTDTSDARQVPREGPVGQAADRVHAQTAPTATRRWPRRTAAAVAVVVVVAAAIGIMMSRAERRPGPSIAVLPFHNMSPDGAGEYISDGLTEEIINALSKLDGLNVSARTSAFAFKGKESDVREVARQLDVETVLEGSVRSDGGYLVVTAQLINAETGYQLWSDRYERQLKDVFTVQEGISQAVVKALRPRLLRQTNDPLVQHSTRDFEAYLLYLRGRHHWYQRTPEGFENAILYLDSAIARDPEYAMAYAGRSDAYSLLGAYEYGLAPPADAFPKARADAETALRLDPDLADAHAALANIMFWYEWNWERAEREYRQAIQLNPGCVSAHHWLSLLLIATGREQEAFAAIKHAQELNPPSLVMTTALGRHFYFTRAYDRAIREYRRALERDSTFVTARQGLGLALLETGKPEQAIAEYETALNLGAPQPLTWALLGNAYGRSGNRAEALTILQRLREETEDRHIPAEYLSLVHLGLGDSEEALNAFDRAYADRSGALVFLSVYPIVDPLRSHPRFQALLQKLELP